MRVSKIDIYKADIPFRAAFKHAIAERKSSGSIFLKVTLSDGTVGWGESLPRAYVTGEDQDGVARSLLRVLPGRFLGRSFEDFEETVFFLRSVDTVDGAAKCAIELALLDAAGKFFKHSVTDALEKADGSRPVYSAVLSGDSITMLAVSALKCRAYGMPHIKVKVGSGEDERRVALLRSIFGYGADIRIDANGAWNSDEAISIINSLSRYRISAVEQPVKKGDIHGMKRVADAVSEAVMADESLCTKNDAMRLISQGACDMFNIRLSKCGGLLSSLEIARIARQAGISFQLGCQVGESGVLSAAGRHFAYCVEGVKYLEGSYAARLLVEDIVREKVVFGPGGRAGDLTGFGLGVTVDEKKLAKYITDKFSVG